MGLFDSIRYCSSGEFHSDGTWIHPQRIIDSYEIIYVLSGCFQIRENGKEYRLQKDSVLLLSPGTMHCGIGSAENVSFFWLHFYADEPPVLPKYIEKTESYHLTLLFRQLLHFSNVQDEYSECNDLLVRLVLIELLRTRQGNENRLVRQVAEWIRARKNRVVRTTDVAAAFEYNPDYLSRLFRKTYGKTLKEYIDDVKMDDIRRRLLTSNDSLKAIAEETGFSDYKYFLRFFRTKESVTPSEFRNLYSHTHYNIR